MADRQAAITALEEARIEAGAMIRELAGVDLYGKPYNPESVQERLNSVLKLVHVAGFRLGVKVGFA